MIDARNLPVTISHSCTGLVSSSSTVPGALLLGQQAHADRRHDEQVQHADVLDQPAQRRLAAVGQDQREQVARQRQKQRDDHVRQRRQEVAAQLALSDRPDVSHASSSAGVVGGQLQEDLLQAQVGRPELHQAEAAVDDGAGQGLADVSADLALDGERAQAVGGLGRRRRPGR